jgi:hypothetical protein
MGHWSISGSSTCFVGVGVAAGAVAVLGFSCQTTRNASSKAGQWASTRESYGHHRRLTKNINHEDRCEKKCAPIHRGAGAHINNGSEMTHLCILLITYIRIRLGVNPAAQRQSIDPPLDLAKSPTCSLGRGFGGSSFTMRRLVRAPPI